MTAIWWPTVRAISWTPLAGAAACLAAVTVVVSVLGARAWPAGLVGIGAAALAAAQVAGMRDPAAPLLAAVPTSTTVRRARRLVLLGPTGLAVWLATVGGPVLGLVALLACGLAAALWCGVAAGVAVPLAWAVVAWSADVDWELHPALVTGAAAVVIVLGRDR